MEFRDESLASDGSRANLVVGWKSLSASACAHRANCCRVSAVMMRRSALGGRQEGGDTNHSHMHVNPLIETRLDTSPECMDLQAAYPKMWQYETIANASLLNRVPKANVATRNDLSKGPTRDLAL